MGENRAGRARGKDMSTTHYRSARRTRLLALAIACFAMLLAPGCSAGAGEAEGPVAGSEVALPAKANGLLSIGRCGLLATRRSIPRLRDAAAFSSA